MTSGYCSDKTVLTRFLRYTDIPDDPNSCWLWTGSIRPQNYGGPHGQLGTQYGVESAHRLSYRLLTPDGHPRPEPLTPDEIRPLRITRDCGNSLCVNPRHLVARPPRPPKVRTGRRRGEQMWNARFTNAEIREIKQLLRQGVRHIDIARRFGTPLCHISAISTGRVYRTIE